MSRHLFLVLAIANLAFAVDARAQEPAGSMASAAPEPPVWVTTPTPAEVRFRRVAVDVASTRPDAVLERRATWSEASGAFLFLPWRSSQSTWEQVCVSPCRGIELDRYSTYRVAGANGISSSKAFTLPQSDATIHLQVDAGNRFAHRAGASLASIGSIAIIVGVSLVAAASSVRGHDDEVRTRDAGWITGGAGLAVAAVGLPLFLLTRTIVRVDDRPLPTASAGPRFVGNGFVF